MHSPRRDNRRIGDMMKKFMLIFLSLFMVATTGFAETFTLDNQTKYSPMHIQWASSAKEVDDDNQAMMQGLKINRDTLQVVPKSGKVTLTIPNKATYFRILVWSKKGETPDFHTNWIEVEPNKTYTLKNDQLVPIALMSGMGC